MRPALLALLCLSPVLAQRSGVPDVYVGVEVLPAHTRLGNAVLYRVYVTIQDNVTEKVQVLPPDFEGFTVLGEPDQQTKPDTSSVTEVITYRLRPEQEGKLTIAPFTAQYQEAAGGAARVVRSSTIAVTVDSQASKLDIRPDRKPDELTDPNILFRQVTIALAAICGGLALMLLLGTWLAKRAARPAPLAAPPPKVPAHYAALRRLQDLRAEKLPERGLRDTYHVRLAGILRDYVTEQYGVASQESTSSETLLALFRRNMPAPLLTTLKDLLARCDGVKFAEHEPDVEAMESLLDDAVRFVEASSQAPDGEVGEVAE